MATFDHAVLLVCLAANIPTDVERQVAALSARVIVHHSVLEHLLKAHKPSAPFVAGIASRCNPGQKGHDSV